MFARNVSMNLKPNTLTEFLKTMENEIVPLLRKQKGFQDEITLSVPRPAFHAFGSWVLGANMGRKLFIAPQLEVLLHFS